MWEKRAKSPLRSREAPITRAILGYLNLLGPHTRAWRNNNQPIYDPKRQTFRHAQLPGLPDILGYHGPRFIAIEVKAGSTRTTWQQNEFLAGARKAGCIALLCHSLDDFIVQWDSATAKTESLDTA